MTLVLPCLAEDPSVNPNYPANISVSLGGSAYFRLSASTTNPPMTYQWQHEGIDIPGATDWFLWVTNVSLADTGGYRAFITNAIGGYTNTRTATLTVDPTFIKMDLGTGPTEMWCPYWVDLDRDGWLELVVVGGWAVTEGRPLMVFENNRDGTLRRDLTNDLTKVSIRGSTIAWADLDNDGDLDGFAGAWGGQKPVFLRNDGGSRFTKVVADQWWTANGIAPIGVNVTSADMDNDGILDLLVGYWGDQGTGFSGTSSVLHGLGNGRFEVDRNSALALSSTYPEQWDWADWNGDGKLDLFGATSGDSSQLDLMFQNLGGGRFDRVTNSPLAKVRDFTIDSAWGDYDNDGDLDVLVSAGGSSTHLYRNLGNGVFALDPSGPIFPANQGRQVAVWGDYDNDGWLDLFMAHDPQASRLFHNRGDGTLEEVTTGSPVSECKAYGCAWGDYDNDGFLDLCATGTRASANYLYRNNLKQFGNTNHWLKVKLAGTASNRDGIGATIRIKTTVAGKELWQMRQIVCQSHGAELIAHFGLGDATSVDLLRIQWPSGNVQELGGIAADQFRVITEPTGITPARPVISVNASITLANQTVGLSYQWQLDGVDLDGQTSRNLSLSHVTADMAGRYSVVISNLSGLRTNFAYLTVNSTFTKITDSPVVANRLDTAGGSWVDIDQDGWIDLAAWNGGLSGTAQTNAVFRNNRVGGFERLTEAQAGNIVGIAGRWWAGVWGDLDRDGDVDCVALRESAPGMNCFLNNGSGIFTNWISSDPLVSDKHAGLASLGDYDNDGWLDVSVISAYGGVRTNRLYHGIGEGRFESVTTGPIVTDRFVSTEANAWSDYDGDGDLDLIVIDPGSSAYPVALYRNDGAGQFTRIKTGAIAEARGAFLVPAWADYDNDGRLDLFLSNNGPCPLFHNEGHGEFTSQTIPTGPSNGYPAWGDFDNDGDLDLVLAHAETNLFFLNEGGQLIPTSMGSLTSEVGAYLPILWGDYDNDGFLDLFVGRGGNEIDSLFHNNGNNNHWLMINLKGTTSNTTGIGAKVRVQASIRGKSVWQLREISGGNRYQGDPRAHFGLGNATNAVTVRIEWPSGTVQELKNVAADQILEVIEPRRPVMSGALRADGSYEVAFTTELDRAYELQASDDLETWVTVATFTGTGNVVKMLDLAPLGAQRFYRVISP